MPAVSKKQQRFFGIVRAAQKGSLKGEETPSVQRAAASMKMKDVKKFASTKHKGLPEKKVTKESTFAGNYNGPLYARWSDVEKGRSKPIDNEEQQTQLENKSGDNSLRDWFGKSRSSDGKPGWVQLGGKYAGKSCAKQPGQTTKPKCGSSKMKRDLSKDEEDAAFRRKNKKDPNPDRSGKAINVKTEETINERGDHWHPDPEKDKKLGGPGANQRAREDRAAASKPKSDPKKLKPGESYMDYAKRQKGYSSAKPKKKSLLGRLGLKKEEAEVYWSSKALDQLEDLKEKEGKKDACYKKVKASAKVWPSAYASGRLVQCRKKGAANYGNSKKEEFDGKTFQTFQEECLKEYEKIHNQGIQNEGAAWTKKSGKNSKGGLNEKGRKSYEKENPGSDLKAPSKKVGNPRRASFCARMKGMRKRQKPSNNTGDDRLSKSLRAWNC